MVEPIIHFTFAEVFENTMDRHDTQQGAVMPKPRIAIIDPNALAALGLRHILQDVMPIMEVDTYGTLTELEANRPDSYFHYFVDISVVLRHRSFFMERQRKTIVLTLQNEEASGLSGFHSLCVNQPEDHLVKQLLAMEQHAHKGGRNLPNIQGESTSRILSDREIEVMILIVEGHINKEIADQLHIGLSTVITHRRNIMEKLNIKSVSALTIYAVMNGYVDINRI